MAIRETAISRYVGVSSESKPTTSVPVGSTFYEYDTGVMFITYDGTNWLPKTETLAQREPFLFRPGSAALASGAVASGTRSGGATVTSVGASTTTWGTEVVYQPKRAGKIDGLSSGGIVSGQLTIGIVSSAATPNGKLIARIRNKSGTWTTFLALTAAIALTTTEIFKTYDIPYLLSTANFNAVPFGVAIGVESDSASNTAIARMMESSFIQGEFEPGT